MITGFIVSGELIDHKTIHLKEAVPLEDGELTVILEPRSGNHSPLKKAGAGLAGLRGKVRWEGNLDEMRGNRI